MRFSKDKTPYRTNMGASLARGGKKSAALPYYVHIEPGGSFVGGGVYMPEAEQLKRIRAALAEDASELRKVVAAKSFKQHFGALEGNQLKTAPKGYPPNHPDLDLLRRTQFLATRAFGDDDVLAAGFNKNVIAALKALKPFNDYFTRVMR